MIVVPNEWLVDRLFSSEQERLQVHTFLDLIEQHNHRLAVRRGGRLAQKILTATANPQARAKRLRLMLFDELKVRLVAEEEIIELPGELGQATPGDDLYLVETAYAVRPCVLVTTDAPLRDSIQPHCNPEIEIRLLEEYLAGPH